MTPEQQVDEFQIFDINFPRSPTNEIEWKWIEDKIASGYWQFETEPVSRNGKLIIETGTRVKITPRGEFSALLPHSNLYTDPAPNLYSVFPPGKMRKLGHPWVTPTAPGK